MTKMINYQTDVIHWKQNKTHTKKIKTHTIKLVRRVIRRHVFARTQFDSVSRLKLIVIVTVFRISVYVGNEISTKWWFHISHWQ